MSNTLTEIAQQLKDTDKKVQLIYAFNGVGKTRLSREFKELIAPKIDDEEAEDRKTKVLYYNAFTEDLFYWDNDLENDIDRKLKIQPNNYTPWMLQEQGKDPIAHFRHYTSDKLTPRFNPDFSEVTFSFERGNDEPTENVKISKGEESIFIWSIFYTLLEQIIATLNISKKKDQETDQFNQLEHVFIDDPVSSLDENHLIMLAVELASLIKSAPAVLKFIITTHSPIFYNVLYNEVNSKKCYLLEHLEDGTFALLEKDGDSNNSFSYHLYLKQIIEKAIADNQIEKFHFTLLRNLYEKTANFLGYAKWHDLLDTASGNKKAYLKLIINFTSHSTLSNESVAYPTPPEKKTVEFLLDNLIDNYGYLQPKRRNSMTEQTKPIAESNRFIALAKYTKNVMLEKSYKEYMEGFSDVASGEARSGFIEVITELEKCFPNPDDIIKESDKKTFAKLFGEYLRVENVLQNYDEFASLKDLQSIDINDSEAVEAFKSGHHLSDDDFAALTVIKMPAERKIQDYRSAYNDIRDWLRREKNANEKEESTIDWDDVVFEVELLKSQEIDLDYILEQIFENNKKVKDKTALVENVRRMIRASIGNRAKESLLVDFINQTDLDKLNDKASVIDAFFTFAQAEQRREAEELINADNLNTEAAKRYIATSIKRKFASDNGTELNAILPKMSPLNPQYLSKKQSVFQKVSVFVEKFKGIGGKI